MPPRFLFLVACLTLVFASAHAKDLVLVQVTSGGVDSQETARDYLTGAQVYFDAVNARGGVQGRKIVVRAQSADSIGAAAEMMNAALRDDDTLALFGLVGDGAATAAAQNPALRGATATLFAPLFGDDLPTSAGTFVLRASYLDEAARIIAWFAANRIGTLAIVHGARREGMARALASVAGAAKMQVLADVPLGSNATTAASQLATNTAQVVLVLGDTLETGQFIRAFRPSHPGTFVIGLSNVNQQTLLELAGPRLAAGVLLSQVSPGPSATQLAVVREHLAAMKQFRDEPASHLTIEGYIAGRALVSVLRSIPGTIDARALRLALQKTREIDAGGFVISLAAAPRRASRFVDLSMVRKDGSLLQ